MGIGKVDNNIVQTETQGDPTKVKPSKAKKDTKLVPVGESTRKPKTEEFTKDPTSGTYAAKKIDSVEIKIQEQKVELLKSTPENRKKIEKDIKELEEKKKQQDKVAVLTETKDNKVRFKMKKAMNVEEFKKLYDISDGVLSNNKELGLKPEWKDIPNDPTYHQEKDWTKCVIPEGKEFTLNPSSIDNQGFLKELFL